jgi:hypothetical protein
MAFVKFKPIASSFFFHSRINDSELKEELKNYISDNEKVMISYKSQRDIVIFTDKRIVLIDKKGIRGFRRTIYSLPYTSISSYQLDVRKFDSKLSIIMDSAHMVMMNFTKGISLEEVYFIYKHIAENTIKG